MARNKHMLNKKTETTYTFDAEDILEKFVGEIDYQSWDCVVNDGGRVIITVTKEDNF